MNHFLPALLLILAFCSNVRSRRSSALRHHQSEDINEIAGDEDTRLAHLHSVRVSEASMCEVPKLQVIHVNDHYPGKYYLPHCTLLHRCGKHAGCCAVESLKCVAAEKEKVTLYFFSVKYDGSKLTERRVEKLVFTNHTRCACAPIDQYYKA